ncbi:MAG: hypothetical protein LAP85_03730 [Acidobacteriia bacterium]|nr:hypothetical protein [Terriglobia bacterium]
MLLMVLVFLDSEGFVFLDLARAAGFAIFAGLLLFGFTEDLACAWAGFIDAALALPLGFLLLRLLAIDPLPEPLASISPGLPPQRPARTFAKRFRISHLYATESECKNCELLLGEFGR